MSKDYSIVINDYIRRYLPKELIEKLIINCEYNSNSYGGEINLVISILTSNAELPRYNNSKVYRSQLFSCSIRSLPGFCAAGIFNGYIIREKINQSSAPDFNKVFEKFYDKRQKLMPIFNSLILAILHKLAKDVMIYKYTMITSIEKDNIFKYVNDYEPIVPIFKNEKSGNMVHMKARKLVDKDIDSQITMYSDNLEKEFNKKNLIFSK